MWTNTRELITNSFNNFNQIFRRDRSNSSIDLDFRRRTIRRSRRTNRTNCLSRSSTRSSTISSQLNRELLTNSSQSPQNSTTIRPPHVHRSSCRSSFSSNTSSSPTSLQHTCFTPLPTSETISHSLNQATSHQVPQPNNRPLSPLLPIPNNTRFPIISFSPYSNLFNQHYFRTISRSFYNLTNEQGNLLPLKKQKNYLSCLINLLVIITIVIAILQPRWFSINGGLCDNKYIGLHESMFSQNNQLSRSSFQLNLNNDQKTYATINHQQEKKPKINYFRLTDDVKTNEINLTDPSLGQANQIALNNLNRNDTNHTIHLQTTAQPTVQLIHLPIQSVPIVRSKIISLPHKSEPVKRLLTKRYSNDETNILQFYKNLADHYQNHVNECLSPDVLSLQRLIIILCVFVIVSSLIQLLLDLIGTTNKYMNLLREHAIFNIIAVIICIMIVSISYLLSNLLTKEQIHKHAALNSQYNHQFYHPSDHAFYSNSNKPVTLVDYFNLNKEDSNGKIEVRLEISYYLVIFSGVFSIVASLVNLFNNKPNLYLINISDPETSNLLNTDDLQNTGYWPQLFNVNNPNLRSTLANWSSYYLQQPPPPYSP